MKYCYIYFDTLQNEPIYVGKGTNERYLSHLKRKDMHPFTARLHRLKKIDGAITIQLYPCPDDEFALLMEEELISKYGRKDLGLGPLLNLTDGGETPSNFIYTDEIRSNLSVANTKALLAGKNDNFRYYWEGKKKTSEEINKTAIPNRGKVRSDEIKKKMADGQKARRLREAVLAEQTGIPITGNRLGMKKPEGKSKRQLRREQVASWKN